MNQLKCSLIGLQKLSHISHTLQFIETQPRAVKVFQVFQDKNVIVWEKEKKKTLA